MSDASESNDLLNNSLLGKPLSFCGRTRTIHGYGGDIFFDNLNQAVIDSDLPGGYGSFDKFCARYLHDDYIMLDIGANIGVTSLVAHRYLSDGAIVAVEASPRNCVALQRTVSFNSLENITVVACAAGSRSETISFNEAGAHGHVLTDSSSLGRQGIAIQVKSIDQIVSELSLPRVDFIKIDIEGFEREAILGASETIKKWNPLFYIEFNSWCQIYVNNDSPLVFYNFLMDRFDYVYKILGDELIGLERADGISFLHENIVIKGCVEDVVVSTDRGRLADAPRHLLGRILQLKSNTDDLRAKKNSLIGDLAKLQADVARLTQKRKKLKSSTYWVITGPVRRLCRMLGDDC